MKREISSICSLLAVACMLVACGPQSTGTAPPEPTDTPVLATPEPTAGATAAPQLSPTALPTPPEATEGEQLKAEANRDGVFTVAANGERQALPAPQQAFLAAGQGVGVDTTGRAILRFADLLTVEVLRDGELQVQELSADQQSAVVTVLQNGGTLINDFSPQEEIARRFTVQTEFAVINATGTRFIVSREANSPLEWVVSLDSSEDDLSVTAKDVTKPVASGVARWIAPIGEPSAGIPANMQNVQNWADGIRNGIPQPAIGEVVWGAADMLFNTAALQESPRPGEPFDLGSAAQGVVKLTLDPSGASYDLQDCNGDGLRDIVIQAGRLQMDFRPVLARVRALDVTVINRDEPGSGILRVLDPGRAEIASQRLAVSYGQGQVISMRSDQPYHYAELELQEGCFLGFSLTPPAPSGEPSAPRPAVENWQAEGTTPTPVEATQRPLGNGLLQALPLATQDYQIAIQIDGATDDWDTLARQSRVDWSNFDTVVFDADCARRYPRAAASNTDLSGRVRFAYDENYLYVAFQVEDDGYVGYSGNDQRYFLGDAPQLLLDIDLPGDFSQAGLSQDDLQLDLHPNLQGQDGPYTGRAALWQLDSLGSQELYEARVASTSAGSGYFLEAAIPWASLDLTPQPGARLGLAASVSDNDTPGSNTQECMISTAPQRDWKNPATWGTLILSPTTPGR